MLEFRKETEQTNSLATVGTVAYLAGENGSVQLSSVRNFQDPNKRVSLRVTRANGDFQYINCSKPVSAALRAKKLSLTEVKTLPVLELPQFNEEGAPVMVMNEDTGVEEPLVLYSISFTGAPDTSATAVTITKEDIDRKAKTVTTVDFSDLIAV